MAIIQTNLPIVVWLALLVFFIVAELATVGLLTIWFAAGAAAALLLAVFHAGIIWQVAVFLLVSAGLLFLTRPWAAKYINGKAPKTNVDALAGKRGRVTETISNLDQTGRAVVSGMDWSARTEDDSERIEEGRLIEVIRVSGAKLIVKRV